MNKFSKILIFIVVTAASLLASETCMKVAMKSIKRDVLGKINSIAKHDLDVELSIWGSSTAGANFNAVMLDSSLNLSCYNMGIEGANIDQYSGLLEEYISYSKKSKFI